MVWPCDEKRRHERCKESNNDEGVREETSRKAQTEVDGQSAERYERTSAPYKACTEPRSLEKDSHGDRLRTGIRSAKVSTYSVEVCRLLQEGSFEVFLVDAACVETQHHEHVTRVLHRPPVT